MIRDTDELSMLRDLKERVARLEAGSNLEHSAIDHGQMRFITSTLRMESGSTLILSGTLTGSGQLTWTGAWTMSGEGTISGPVDITGAVTITGPLTIDGDTTISGDVEVVAGGKITAGALTIDPTSRGGSIKFVGGPEVYANGSELSLYSTASGGYVNLTDGRAYISGPGLRALEITSSGIRFQSLPTRTRANAENAPVGTVWSDVNGNLFRVIA